jgi:hypothetical protein
MQKFKSLVPLEGSETKSPPGIRTKTINPSENMEITVRLKVKILHPLSA